MPNNIIDFPKENRRKRLLLLAENILKKNLKKPESIELGQEYEISLSIKIKNTKTD